MDNKIEQLGSNELPYICQRQNSQDCFQSQDNKQEMNQNRKGVLSKTEQNSQSPTYFKPKIKQLKNTHFRKKKKYSSHIQSIIDKEKNNSFVKKFCLDLNNVLNLKQSEYTQDSSTKQNSKFFQNTQSLRDNDQYYTGIQKDFLETKEKFRSTLFPKVQLDKIYGSYKKNQQFPKQNAEIIFDNQTLLDQVFKRQNNVFSKQNSDSLRDNNNRDEQQKEIERKKFAKEKLNHMLKNIEFSNNLYMSEIQKNDLVQGNLKNCINEVFQIQVKQDKDSQQKSFMEQMKMKNMMQNQYTNYGSQKNKKKRKSSEDLKKKADFTDFVKKLKNYTGQIRLDAEEKNTFNELRQRESEEKYYYMDVIQSKQKSDNLQLTQQDFMKEKIEKILENQKFEQDKQQFRKFEENRQDQLNVTNIGDLVNKQIIEPRQNYQKFENKRYIGKSRVQMYQHMQDKMQKNYLKKTNGFQNQQNFQSKMQKQRNNQKYKSLDFKEKKVQQYFDAQEQLQIESQQLTLQEQLQSQYQSRQTSPESIKPKQQQQLISQSKEQQRQMLIMNQSKSGFWELKDYYENKYGVQNGNKGKKQGRGRQQEGQKQKNMYQRNFDQFQFEAWGEDDFDSMLNEFV